EANYARYGIKFYGVDLLDHGRALARAFYAEFHVRYPSPYDPSGSLTAVYEVYSPPSYVLVDRRGVVVARYPGEASQAQLAKLIDQKLITSSGAANGSPSTSSCACVCAFSSCAS